MSTAMTRSLLTDRGNANKGAAVLVDIIKIVFLHVGRSAFIILRLWQRLAFNQNHCLSAPPLCLQWQVTILLQRTRVPARYQILC